MEAILVSSSPKQADIFGSDRAAIATEGLRKTPPILLHVSLGRASTVQASVGVDEVHVLARSRRHPIGSSAWAWRSGSTPRSGAATLSGTVVSTSATAFHGALEEDQEHDRNNAHLHLQQIIDATPARDHLTLLTTRFGKIYGDTGFSDQFHEWCDRAGLPARWLAQGRMRRPAEAGCTAHEIAAISTHAIAPGRARRRENPIQPESTG